MSLFLSSMMASLYQVKLFLHQLSSNCTYPFVYTSELQQRSNYYMIKTVKVNFYMTKIHITMLAIHIDMHLIFVAISSLKVFPEPSFPQLFSSPFGRSTKPFSVILLGWLLIRPKRIYTFYCFMLLLYHFCIVLPSIFIIFMD